MPKLNQIIAIEAGTKKTAEDVTTRIYQMAQKPEIFAGRTRTYRPADDEGETMPPESQFPQISATHILDVFSKSETQIYDITATKLDANTRARGDVVVDGVTVLENVPVETLLFLEKRLGYAQQVLNKLPILDPTMQWELDTNTGFHDSAPVVTNRNKKVLRNHVKAEATDKHPAQVETYTEDVKVGEWTTIQLSGAMPPTELDALKEKVSKLTAAVKIARENANSIDAPEVNIGRQVFDYLYQ